MVRAPAKLNLHLEVLGRRPDGYHEIESVMHAIDLCDRLDVAHQPEPGVRLEVTGRDCPAGPENLVARAANAWLAAAGATHGVRIALEKRIPLGAGLGGGSSDAAACLAALDRLAPAPLGPERLHALAAALGSDVPFFLAGGTAIATGRGERIERLPPADAPRLAFVVVYPGLNVSTASVYGALGSDLTKPRRNLRSFLQILGRSRDARNLVFHNALTAPVRRLHPRLGELQDRLSERAGRPFAVTGSGSAMFAAFSDRASATTASHGLQAVAAGETFVCESLPGSPGL